MKSLAGLRVLVVDDDQDSCDLLAIALTTLCSVTVEIAHSARQALEIFVQQQPQVIITDIAMPNQDGYWLLQRIRAQNPCIPILACSARWQEDYQRDLAMLFDNWLLKPIDFDELVDKLTQTVGAQQFCLLRC